MGPLEADGYKWWEKDKIYIEKNPYKMKCNLTKKYIHQNQPLVALKINNGSVFIMNIEEIHKFFDSLEKLSTRIINKYNEKSEFRITTRKVSNVENIRCDSCNDKVRNNLVEMYEKDKILDKINLHLNCAISMKKQIKDCLKRLEESTYQFINEHLCVGAGEFPKCILCDAKPQSKGYWIKSRRFEVCGSCCDRFINELERKYSKHIYEVDYNKSNFCYMCNSYNRSIKGKMIKFDIDGNVLRLHKSCCETIIENINKEDIDRIKNSYTINGLL